MTKKEKQVINTGFPAAPNVLEEEKYPANKDIIPQSPMALLANQDVFIMKDLLGSFSEQTGAFFG